MELELDDVASLERDCVEAFGNADEDGKGFLTRSDYKVAVLELCGYKPSSYEIDAVWTQLGSCSAEQYHKTEAETAVKRTTSVSDRTVAQEDGMDQPTFVSMMTERLRQKDKDEMIRQVFIAFDVHLRGFITTSDCIQAFKEAAPHISEELIEGWFSEVDSDSDGRVTFRDFEMMMKSFVLVAPSLKK